MKRTFAIAAAILTLATVDAHAAGGRSAPRGAQARVQQSGARTNSATSGRGPMRARVARAAQAVRQVFVRPAPTANPSLQHNKLNLSSSDLQHLNARAQRFDSVIRQGFTNRVELYVTEASRSAGVSVRQVSGSSGPNVFEVTGIDKAGGVIDFVMIGGASGHVMQKKYGGRPMSTVEEYGRTDTVMLTHKGPNDARTKPVVQVKSRGLVTQEGVRMKLEKGTHTFYYFRRGANGFGSGGEGSEPELRTVQFNVK